MNISLPKSELTSDCLIHTVLTGNPNSGKTSLFNALTGSSQRVGNYPGVTVEKREGRWRQDGREIKVRDLPGSYGLNGYSPEERIACKELRDDTYDVVIVVIDAMALHRSLVYLLQVMEQGSNPVLVLNMADEARRAGQRVDLDILQRRLKIPVVETAAHQGQGVDRLRQAIIEAAVHPSPGIPDTLADLMADMPPADEPVERMQRYAAAVGAILHEALITTSRPDARALTNRIDSVAAHRLWGIPIFLAVMYGVFWVTFTLGAAPMDWIETGIGALSDLVVRTWPGDPDSPLLSLLVDGVMAGVGGVLIFLPNIILLFAALSFLEDTGYMARAAFLMDRFLHRFGLHGKSFLPLLTGFGCSIPGIMATRTLENERDRLVTMMVLPLMSCGARLPIWMLIIPAFFPSAWQAPALWGVYFTGVALALGLAMLLRRTVFKGPATPFVLELPPYRLPVPRTVLTRLVERSGLYLRKAGTVILAISILLWVASSFPKLDSFEVDRRVSAGLELSQGEIEAQRASESLQHSVTGRIGLALEPVFKPLGYDWRIVTATIGAFAAKEVFVSQMNIVYALDAEEGAGDLRSRLKADYSPLVGVSLILFLLIGTPCMATVAVVRRESGRWRYAWLQFGGLTVLSYLAAFIAFNVGGLFT